ncbi:cytochrome P450 71D11-like [Phalaenopsis equestris]|uniref:cytochrome P450 71D11-like n=1 Tax=Phalaenopsis equestris TaxID=78828 RepID=UPI0009E542A9|nr:cytochrome P450 71D11-like [Phalaenopsis equestris]
MEVLYYAFFLSSLLILFLNLKFKKSNKLQKGCKEAPGPWNLPVIGNLHLFASRRPPHQSFRDLSAVYGQIMRLKLGDIKIVIISSAKAAREIMRTHDADFATRPLNDSIRAIFYGSNNISFGTSDEFWRQMRRLCNMELLSIKRVRSLRAIREVEVSHLIQHIGASSGTVTNLSSKMVETNNNIMARAVIGDRCDDQNLFLSALDDAVEILSGFTIVDLFPSVPFLGRITGFQQKFEKCRINLDLMAEKIVEEHKKKRAKHFSNNDTEKLKEEDLTDVLLRVQREDSLPFPLTNDNIKALINDILMAGTDTTSRTLEWAMSEMIQNPAILEKAQREVREFVSDNGGLRKLVDEELISGKLSYLQLVIKETLRLHPPAPLLLPRENQETKEIMGYVIPAKTKVLINMWAIGREQKYWGDPENFRPERFEENPVDFKGAHFEYVPFGAGRRICPGMQFGLFTLEIILAHLLYYFDWKFLGKKGEMLDMREAFGVILKRETPLCLIPTLRFPILPA